MKTIIKILDRIAKACDLIAIVLIICVFFIMIAQVFTRYILNYAFPWSEELSCYLTIYAMTFGSISLYRRGAHPRVELLYDVLPKKLRYYLNYFFYILISAFLIIIIIYGTKLSISSIKVMTAATRMSKAIPVSAIAISSFLMLMQSIVLLYENYMDYKNYRSEEEGVVR